MLERKLRNLVQPHYGNIQFRRKWKKIYFKNAFVKMQFVAQLPATEKLYSGFGIFLFKRHVTK